MENKYRVSQHVWDRLNAIFWSSEVCQRRLRILRKNVFCSIKLLFKPFLWTAKRQMEFLGNFFPKILCSNLFSKLFEIGEKWLKNPLSFLAVPKKGWKSNFLEQNTIFFCKRSSLRSQTFLSLSQTCWTPCMIDVVNAYMDNFRTHYSLGLQCWCRRHSSIVWRRIKQQIHLYSLPQRQYYRSSQKSCQIGGHLQNRTTMRFHQWFCLNLRPYEI